MMGEQRKYSIAEIDTMRSAITARMLARVAQGRTSFTTSVDPTPPDRIEDQLRTYMQNGTDPQELVDAAKAAGA